MVPDDQVYDVDGVDIYMPEELERELKQRATAKFPGNKKRQDRYVYSTMRKTGWVPGCEKPRANNPTTDIQEVKVSRSWEEPF